jgi:hypothetical protein
MPCAFLFDRRERLHRVTGRHITSDFSTGRYAM